MIDIPYISHGASWIDIYTLLLNAKLSLQGFQIQWSFIGQRKYVWAWHTTLIKNSNPWKTWSSTFEQIRDQSSALQSFYCRSTAPHMHKHFWVHVTWYEWESWTSTWIQVSWYTSICILQKLLTLITSQNLQYPSYMNSFIWKMWSVISIYCQPIPLHVLSIITLIKIKPRWDASI